MACIALSHYETLGVVSTASADEIHAAYRSVARRVHPDAGGDEARMAAVNEAYRVLSDPGRRAMYDARGRAPVASASAFVGARVAGELDDDDDADFVPMPRWQRRLPAWAMLVLGSLFAVFLVTGYAGSGRGTTTTSLPSVDGALEPGSCVREAPGGIVEEVACAGRRDGVVVSLIRITERCPPGADGLRRSDGDGYACIRRM